MHTTLKDAYFLMISAADRIMNYREVTYFDSEDALLKYIQAEFRGTDGAAIADCTVAQLMQGQSYEQGHRMGSGTTTTKVQVVHNSNLCVLFRFLDSVKIEDDDGKYLLLSHCLIKAETPADIKTVIRAFNESCDNYW